MPEAVPFTDVPDVCDILAEAVHRIVERLALNRHHPVIVQPLKNKERGVSLCRVADRGGLVPELGSLAGSPSFATSRIRQSFRLLCCRNVVQSETPYSETPALQTSGVFVIASIVM